MTVAEILARISSTRRALARCMRNKDEGERDWQVESFIGHICALRRELLVADYECHIEIASKVKPVFEWVVWKQELSRALAACKSPDPKGVENYEEILAEIDLRVQLSNSIVDIDALEKKFHRDETSSE